MEPRKKIRSLSYMGVAFVAAVDIAEALRDYGDPAGVEELTEKLLRLVIKASWPLSDKGGSNESN